MLTDKPRDLQTNHRGDPTSHLMIDPHPTMVTSVIHHDSPGSSS